MDPGALEAASAGNLKRTWIATTAPDWSGADAEGRAFLEQATEVKTIWVALRRIGPADLRAAGCGSLRRAYFLEQRCGGRALTLMRD